MVSPILFGKYHLIEKISAGGMAEVYKAKSYGVAGFEKILVIKKILPHLNSDREFVEMFRDEAKICGQLSHGNIVQVIDCGKEGETYFMAMEFVNGYDLSRVLVKGRQAEDLTQPLSLFLVGEVLKALDYAHRRRDREQRELNIVHCDVSPQNVLLSFEGEVKLTDFGISKAAFQSASSQGVVRGKYAYMSPEQVEGRPLDRRSDIFSVGIILWELLTAKRLFKTESVEKTLKRVMQAEIPAPSSLVEGIHPELDRITLKALSRPREGRYQDDQEMLDDLSTFMYSQGMQVTAADLAEYLRRVFAKELQKSREDDPSWRAARSGDDDAAGRRAMFIPTGSGRSIPSYQPEVGSLANAGVSRIGVAMLCAEWNLDAAPNRTSAEVARLTRGLMERFEARVDSTGGELWEVNHNSFVAAWRMTEDPAGSMTLALECAIGLRDEVTTTFGTDAPGCRLDVAVHAGAVVIEKRTGNPLLGWQVTRTGGLPRLMVNLNGGSGLTFVSTRGRELVEGRFVFRERKLEGRIGSFLPGLFELTGATSEAGAARPKFSPFTRYLGREAMLASLVDRLRDAGDGRPSVALLLGDEGMGRSRLREEYRQSCRKLGAAFFTGACQRELRHAAYAPLLDALRHICGILPPESAESEKQKLGRLVELGLSPEDLDLVHSLYDEPSVMFGQGVDASRKNRVFALFDKILAGLTKDGPMVLAIEDFHYADALTEEYLATQSARGRSRRMVLLLEVPDGYTRSWMQTVKPHLLHFDALSPPLVEEMLKDMLGVLEVSPELLQTVSARAYGNPLLIKELVGLMVEEDQIRVERRVARPGNADRTPPPETVEELLARRFARVPDASRTVLKAGAVLGQLFPLAVVERLLPGVPEVRETLQKVVALGILKERQLGNATWYRFRHTGYRHLAASVPGPISATELHRRLADGLKVWGDYARGNVSERVGFSSWVAKMPDSFAALERAGDKLFFEHAYASSLAFYRRALEPLKGQGAAFDAHRKRIRWRIAGTLLHQGVEAESEDLLQDALAAARRAGVEAEASELLVDLSQQHVTRGELERATQVLRVALAMSHRGEDRRRIAIVERELAHALRLSGATDEALYYLRSGYQRAKLAGGRLLLLEHALEVGAYYHQIGEWARAVESYRRVLSAARDEGAQALLVKVLIAVGDLHRDLSREEVALRAYKEALGRARSMEEPAAESSIMGSIGALCLDGGVPHRAHPYLKAALDLAARLNREELITSHRLSLAYLRGLTEDPRAALREIQAVMARPETGMLRHVVARAHLLTGRCHLKAREVKRAREAFERALNVGRELKNAPLTRQALAALNLVGAAGRAQTRAASPAEGV